MTGESDKLKSFTVPKERLNPGERAKP